MAGEADPVSRKLVSGRERRESRGPVAGGAGRQMAERVRHLGRRRRLRRVWVVTLEAVGSGIVVRRRNLRERGATSWSQHVAGRADRGGERREVDHHARDRSGVGDGGRVTNLAGEARVWPRTHRRGHVAMAAHASGASVGRRPQRPGGGVHLDVRCSVFRMERGCGEGHAAEGARNERDGQGRADGVAREPAEDRCSRVNGDFLLPGLSGLKWRPFAAVTLRRPVNMPVDPCAGRTPLRAQKGVPVGIDPPSHEPAAGAACRSVPPFGAVRPCRTGWTSHYGGAI